MATGDVAHMTLEQAEATVWPEPPADATKLIRTVHALRRKPIHTLTVEDLRVLIGQREGIEILLPRALDLLEADPLAAGDYFPGDLLSVVLRISPEFWRTHGDLARRLAGAVGRLESRDDLELYFPPDDDIWRDVASLRAAAVL